MIGSELLTRAGIASSIVAHLALIAWLILGTGARPFDPAPAEAITVDLIAPTQIELPSTKDGTADPDPTAAEPDPSDMQERTAPKEAATADISPDPSAPEAPALPASSEPLPPPATPDITVQYGTMFGLSESGFDPDATPAKIERSAVDNFRAHLKTCSVLPQTLAPDDHVKIVMRVALLPSGHLAAAPALIEASASAKGPLLMQAAIRALETCQPYTMLPADKYDEWRVLDLGFTPHDFKGG